MKVKVLVTQSCPTLGNPMDCSPPGSSVNVILQARILEWVAISFSSGSSQSRDWIWVSCKQADSLPSEPPEKPYILWNLGKLIAQICAGWRRMMSRKWFPGFGREPPRSALSRDTAMKGPRVGFWGEQGSGHGHGVWASVHSQRLAVSGI